MVTGIAPSITLSIVCAADRAPAGALAAEATASVASPPTDTTTFAIATEASRPAPATLSANYVALLHAPNLRKWVAYIIFRLNFQLARLPKGQHESSLKLLAPNGGLIDIDWNASTRELHLKVALNRQKGPLLREVWDCLGSNDGPFKEVLAHIGREMIPNPNHSLYSGTTTWRQKDADDRPFTQFQLRHSHIGKQEINALSLHVPPESDHEAWIHTFFLAHQRALGLRK